VLPKVFLHPALPIAIDCTESWGVTPAALLDVVKRIVITDAVAPTIHWVRFGFFSLLPSTHRQFSVSGKPPIPVFLS
jgi:hypothetical protein